MQGTTSDMIKAELPVGRTAVCRTLACLAVLLLVCGLFAGSALSEPLSGAAAKNFEASLYKMDAAEFGELRTLNASLLRQTYEELRERVDALLEDEKRRTWRQSWEIMRDGFVSVAISRPAPTLGAQAVFRAAECQEALAGYSRAARDWRMAVRLYESVARCYPGSVRADDALLACARLSLANLRDSRGAGAYIDWILEKYARADSAEGARALKDALGSGGSSARELAVKMSAHNAARTDAQAAASRKNAGKPAASSAAESRAKAGAASVKRSEEAAAARTAQRAAKRTRPAPAAAGQIVPALTVTIDAGHGGQDPGTMHNGVIERDVTLDVALRLGRILKESGFRVNYTRTTNRTVSLPDRAVYANSRGSDLFISIHVNANLSEKVRGLEVYYLDTAPSPSAPVLVADRENGSAGRGRAVRAASAQKTLTSRLLASRRLAGCVHRELHDFVLKSGYEVESKGVRKAPFYVLAATGMPAVLAEIGYCSNPGDAFLLRKSEYRQAVARGLAEGILAWAGRERERATAERSTGTRIR